MRTQLPAAATKCYIHFACSKPPGEYSTAEDFKTPNYEGDTNTDSQQYEKK